MKILMTGGTGMIGGYFLGEAIKLGHQVVALTRTPEKHPPLPNVEFVGWDGKSTGGWLQYLESVDAVINLAGANISHARWTPAYKKILRESRINAGNTLAEAILNAHHKPAVLLQISATGFYGNTGEPEIDEKSPAGDDFLGNLCVEWEASTRRVEEVGVRRSIMRTGIVLKNKESALGRLQLIFGLFAGGPMGWGNQWWPWIHIKDQARAMFFLLENKSSSGIYNLVSPNPVRMKDFGKILGKTMRRPYWLPAPAFALKIILGEMSKIVLDGHKVFPRRLIKDGFEFNYPNLDKALADIIPS